jgi:hypothetical protein
LSFFNFPGILATNFEVYVSDSEIFCPTNPQIIHLFKKVYIFYKIFSLLASRDTFVPTKIVLKVGFLERDFEHDHLAEKSYWTKMGQKYTVYLYGGPTFVRSVVCPQWHPNPKNFYL